jgi:Lrp/AsnC family transcriptional regulator of ectoine degradation
MAKQGSGVKLDRIDLNILSVLQRRGRITKLALAEQVHLSPTPCWERLKRLEETGIIAGYHARIALNKIASSTTLWTEVTLRKHGREDFGRFEAAVKSRPEIVECWAIGGGIDYLMKVVARDVDGYQRMVDELLEAEVGIDRYFTYIVTKPVKEGGELPIDSLLRPAS